MTIALRALASLDPLGVGQQFAEVVQRVQEDNPNLDLRIGVFSQLLAYYHALLAEQRQENVNDYLLGRSLAAIEANPELSDPSLVDDVLSNFGVTRLAGVTAHGEITVVVNADVTVTVAAGAIFQANGFNFIVDRVFVAKVEEAQINDPGDRLLTSTADGNWAFTITATAEAVGPDYNVKKDSLMVPVVLPSNYVNSFASSDFAPGFAAETNTELLTRLQEGLAAKGLGGRVNMAGTLKAVDAFSRTTALSVVGFGDPEMLRDKHTIFPVAYGGRVDWYTRTQEQVFRLKLTKTATLVSSTGVVGTWQISLTRDEAPGFYEVRQVRPKDSVNVVGGFDVISDIRVPDLTGQGFVPDVNPTSFEWVYTRFQTATIQFADTDTDASMLPLGSKADYDLEARCLPLIADIQDYFLTADNRPMPYDLLVKAPVPCFVQLGVTIYKRSGQADPDIQAMRSALSQAINDVGFVGKLYASQLTGVADRYLLDGQAASAIDMFGRLRYPDGTPVYLRDTEVLVVPYDPANMVSPRTVQFFCSPEDVTISVQTSVPSNL